MGTAWDFRGQSLSDSDAIKIAKDLASNGNKQIESCDLSVSCGQPNVGQMLVNTHAHTHTHTHTYTHTHNI